ISGNRYNGIVIDGNYVYVKNNYIGTDVSGYNPVANKSDGIVIRGQHNQIGGSRSAGADNLISGNGTSDVGANAGNGIRILQASNNTIRGNLIGTDASGLAGLGNWGDGVMVEGDGSTNNTIGGGTDTNLYNTISKNKRTGINRGGMDNDYN